jgi:hypothetical protein
MPVSAAEISHLPQRLEIHHITLACQELNNYI